MERAAAAWEADLERLDLASRLEALHSPDEPLTESVYGILREAICSGELAGGSRLAQLPLSQRLGISRTPVRDALQRLASEDLVRSISWRGFVVNDFSAHEVLEIYDVRLALEPLAAAEAIGRHSRLDLVELSENCDRTAATPPDRIAELYELNREFHAHLVQPCDNRLLVRMLGQLWQLPASLRMFHVQTKEEVAPIQSTASEHRAIVEAVEAGEADLAVERIRQHVSEARQATVTALGAPPPAA